MNTSSQTDIYNMALAAIGVSRFITSPTEGSLQANTCNVFWDSVRDQCLQDAPWGFAMRFAELQLITKTVPGWLNVYAVPSDCLQAREVSPTPSTQNIPWSYRGRKVSFEVIENEAGGGLALACNIDSPTLAYTARIKTVPLWSPAFVNAVSLLLASRIVSPLSSDPVKYAPLVAKAYEIAISKAAALSMNEGRERPEPDSELISIRG
jgi:hypothetical protein